MIVFSKKFDNYSRNFWSTEHKGKVLWLCQDILNEYFIIPDGTHIIWVEFSTTKLPESYLIRKQTAAEADKSGLQSGLKIGNDTECFFLDTRELVEKLLEKHKKLYVRIWYA